ncbi:ShlB/FhaC/HecB family hemolysin secretion/activation protein [Massilia sp. TWP1-3-3]|uniref:ShlB/FhaC/HecB family hemolysin secretion/activation protein n=1 Tax=Massilia sp. TWP1-3-3 TaxID=2804573 RepID=UPI003CFAA0BF
MNQSTMNTSRSVPVVLFPRRQHRLAAMLAVLWVAAPAWSQVAPTQIDSAALQRQEAERRRFLNEQAPPAAPAPAVIRDETREQAKPAPASGPKFMLQQVVFGESAFLSKDELAAIAARYVGREADFALLTSMVEEVNARYRAHGVVTARAVIGAQKIQNGVVRIDLVEARLAGVSVAGATYTSKAFVAEWFAPQQGKTLVVGDLEQQIKRFNRSGELQIEAGLRPGASVGQTDMLLTVREPKRLQLRAFAGNEGARSIGEAQVGFDAAVNGPLGLGDRASVYVSRSRGATSGTFSYAVPINHLGGRLTETYSDSVTDIVAGPYRELGISGRSKSVQIGVTQPLWRTGGWWFDLGATAGKTRSRNQVGALELSRTSILNQSLVASAAGTFEQRTVNLGLTVTHATEQSATGQERSFNLRQLSGSWAETMGAKQFALLRASVQDTSVVNLSPSLLFQLGGTGTVRGYEAGALSGDRGYLLNLELHRALRENVDAYVFADAGEVRTTGVPRQRAHSAGVGTDFQLGAKMRGNITAARALKKVMPDQSDWRVTGRVSYEF